MDDLFGINEEHDHGHHHHEHSHNHEHHDHKHNQDNSEDHKKKKFSKVKGRIYILYFFINLLIFYTSF